MYQYKEIILGPNSDNALNILKREYNRRHPIEIKYIWKTKDGNLITLNEMTDKHLQNAINYIEREDYFEVDYDALSEAYYD